MAVTQKLKPSRGTWYLLLSAVMIVLLALSACNGGAVPEVGEDPPEEEVVEAVPEEETVGEVTEETELLEPEDVLDEPAEETLAAVDQVSIRASELLDLDVYNAEGEQWGEVDELAVGLDSEQVRYMVMSFGGFLDIGDQSVAVPIEFVGYTPAADAVTLNIDQEMLSDAPSIDLATWTTDFNEQYDTSEIDQFWNTAEIFEDSTVVRATTLLDDGIFDLDASTWGEVEDMVIDLENGDVQYVILSSDEFLTPDEYLAVPLAALNFDAAADELSLNVDQPVLDAAPTFTADAWPNFTDPAWDIEWFNYWDPVEFAEIDVDAVEVEETGIVEEETIAPVSQLAVRADELLDLDIVNANAEQWGEVDDLVIGQDTNQVRYMIMSFGGFLDIGDESTVIPIDQVALAPTENSVTLMGIEQSDVEAAPTFDVSDWTGAVNPEWDLEAEEYWATTALAGGGMDDQEFVEEALISAEDFLDYDVFVPEVDDINEFEEWGEVEDVIFSLSDGRILYVVLESEGFFDLNEEMVAVPMDAITFNPDRSELTLGFDQTMLQDAPTFTDDTWPNLEEPEWDSAWARYWVDNEIVE